MGAKLTQFQAEVEDYATWARSPDLTREPQLWDAEENRMDTLEQSQRDWFKELTREDTTVSRALGYLGRNTWLEQFENSMEGRLLAIKNPSKKASEFESDLEVFQDSLETEWHLGYKRLMLAGVDMSRAPSLVTDINALWDTAHTPAVFPTVDSFNDPSFRTGLTKKIDEILADEAADQSAESLPVSEFNAWYDRYVAPPAAVRGKLYVQGLWSNVGAWPDMLEANTQNRLQMIITNSGGDQAELKKNLEAFKRFVMIEQASIYGPLLATGLPPSGTGLGINGVLNGYFNSRFVINPSSHTLSTNEPADFESDIRTYLASTNLDAHVEHPPAGGPSGGPGGGARGPVLNTLQDILDGIWKAGNWALN